MFTSFIVVTYNSRDQIDACLHSITELQDDDYEIVVVDNASTDGSPDLVESICPQAKVFRSRTNLGFGGAVNIGCRRSHGDLLAIVNPDVELRTNWLSVLKAEMVRDSSIAVVGSKLLYPDGKTIQHAGGRIAYPLALPSHDGYGEEDQGQHDRAQSVDYVTGAAFAMRKVVLEEIGYFDEGFYPAYFEETDVCLRARQAGYEVRYLPEAVATHHESVTIGKETLTYYHLFHRNRVRFVLKHYSTDQIWRDFLPAELARLDSVGTETELQALQQAYIDNLAVLTGHASFLARPVYATPLENNERRRELLVTLRYRAEFALSSRFSKTDALSDRLAMLAAKCRVAEPILLSHTPVFGPAISRFRRAWNWMSTKWYVLPILQEQNGLNLSFAEGLQELALAVRATTQWVIAQESAGLSFYRDLILLEGRLAAIEAAVERRGDSKLISTGEEPTEKSKGRTIERSRATGSASFFPNLKELRPGATSDFD